MIALSVDPYESWFEIKCSITSISVQQAWMMKLCVSLLRSAGGFLGICNTLYLKLMSLDFANYWHTIDETQHLCFLTSSPGQQSSHHHSQIFSPKSVFSAWKLGGSGGFALLSFEMCHRFLFALRIKVIKSGFNSAYHLHWCRPYHARFHW